MASEQELVAIRVAIQQAQKSAAELGKVARALDDIGDEADQASRKTDKAARSVARLNAASTSTRVNLGPFSTSMRGATLVVGGLVLAAQKLTPAVLSAGEAVASLAGGAGGAGGVGLLALGQASGVAALGLGDLMEALGGSEEAARNLSPEAYELYRTLTDAHDALKDTAQAAMLPGLTRGGMAAMRNFDRLQTIVHATGRELGDLAGKAGAMLGSDEWGRDISTLGRTNVKIIGNLGDAGLHLADALKDILVEAAPLAEWLSKQAEHGADLVEIWADGARKGGDLRNFFQGAKTDLDNLGTSVGNVVSGIENLFSNDAVDGSGMLADLEKITQRFEDWTDSPAVREDFGKAITREIADGVAAASGAAAETLPKAAAAAAVLFWDTFWTADPEAKALLALMTGAKLSGAIRGMTPLTPLFVQQVGGVPGVPGDGPVSRIPDWLKAVAGAALRNGGPVVAVGAGLTGAELLAKTGPPGGVTPETPQELARRRNSPGNDPFAIGRERVTDPGEVRPGNAHPLDVPGPFDPIINLNATFKVGEETLARAHARGVAKRDARKR